MKISRIETIPISVPLNPQLAIKSGREGSHTKSPFWLVKIYTDTEQVGLDSDCDAARATIAPGWALRWMTPALSNIA